MTDLRQARLIVSGDALLTVTEAARLIGGREARAWLEAHVPVRYVAGQRRVLWRDVIEASAHRPVEAPRPASRRRASGIRLADL